MAGDRRYPLFAEDPSSAWSLAGDRARPYKVSAVVVQGPMPAIGRRVTVRMTEREARAIVAGLSASLEREGRRT